jgi:hypothetical protein
MERVSRCNVKQLKKGILLRQVDDAPYEVELGVLYKQKNLTIFN